jgi:glycosyltransferase involved in cell wall biosynthesis
VLRAVENRFTRILIMIPDVVSESTASLAFNKSDLDGINARGGGVRPKVVIGHPMLGLGGSEAVVMWLIEALKKKCDMTIATTSGWNRQKLNEFYGTQVEEDQIRVRVAPLPWPLRSRSVAALRGAVYQRFARRIAGEYDVRISAYNITDWGRPAIHFLADFSWNKQIRDRVDPPSSGLIYEDSLLRKAYLGLASAIELPSGRDPIHDDQLIANSRWTAETVRQNCDVQCAATIYPPVWSEFPDVAWEDKENSFVMIGRISPEKRIEKAISILSAVRSHGHSIKLHLCGHIEDDLYGHRIDALCRKNSEWIIPEGRVSGERKISILAGCRYGIQARSAEPFGISVAEMVKAGAIVFVPHDGGQAEIVENPDLLFTSESDAAAKIHRVLQSAPLQSALHISLKEKAQSFSKTSFISSVQEFLESFMRKSSLSANAVAVPRV